MHTHIDTWSTTKAAATEHRACTNSPIYIYIYICICAFVL